MGRSRRLFAALVVLGLTSIAPLPGGMLGYERTEASNADRALEGTERWNELIEQAANESGVPKEVVLAMMAADSSLETDRRTAVDGVGLMELRPTWQPTARDFDGDLSDPATNIRAATTVLSEGYAAWGSWDMAAAAYTGMLDGEGNLVDLENGTSAEEFLARFQRNLAVLGYPDSADDEQEAGSPEQPDDAPVPAGITALKHALSVQGTPYVFGGGSPGDGGFDCSGLVRWAYQQVGKSLPRGTHGQWQAVTPVDRSQLAPGDLIFFANTYASGITHVAMYAGDGLMIHAPHEGETVKLDPLSSPYWQAHLAGYGTISGAQ